MAEVNFAKSASLWLSEIGSFRKRTSQKLLNNMKCKPEPGVTAKTRGDTMHRIQDFMLPGLFLGVNVSD
jgi:hypothetical protein